MLTMSNLTTKIKVTYSSNLAVINAFPHKNVLLLRNQTFPKITFVVKSEVKNSFVFISKLNIVS
jgi:Flp pilus assembly protein TadG